MQAIQVKYIGPTNTKGSRVKASALGATITLDWDDALNIDENHRRAANALIKKLEWRQEGWVMGWLPSDIAVFVWTRLAG